ncbi:hypothetical protein FXV77_05460 [Sphingobacterium phlebotomi]|uniref:Uncharacterized protein n=1 Tax=Sphingobacterium phlebotomi TaxID=2605433 RepID=A0A5D4HB77_9SPHI|nr:hypothetical protein [Sphingobacterium phlebotomi]TYR37453.1 hypothetical protein FXV77_05460 [Sphingobacterium phlebotomi]
MEKEKWEMLRKQAAAIEKALSEPQKVCNKSCDQCLFTKNKIVSDQRKHQILEQCERDETHFICHKGSIAGQNVVCNGFFRNKTTPYLELAKATKRIVFVDPKTLEKPAKISKKKGKGLK